MKIVAWMLTATIILFADSSFASGTIVDVIPRNIDKQPLSFSVQVKAQENGALRFEVGVSSGRDTLSPRHCGTLTIWRNVATARVLKNAMGARPNPSLVMASVDVSESKREDTLRYSFSVHSSLVPQTTFLFANFESSGMPAFDGYEIVLGEYLPRSE